MDDDSERILCAAIWFDDGKVYHGQPKNITSGRVYCGWRHHSIFGCLNMLAEERKALGKATQGFITDCNRFLNRKEAAVVAFCAGQIDEYSNCLISEDLY